MKDLVTEGLRLALRTTAGRNGLATVFRALVACFAEADQLMKTAPRGPIVRERLNMGLI